MDKLTLHKEKTPIQHIQDAYNQAGNLHIRMGLGSKKPFLGQTVHYYDHYHHQRAAIITAIHKDGSTCDLCVLYPTRQEFHQSVKHDADHEKETWDWVPYQEKNAEELANSIYKSLQHKQSIHGRL